MFIKHKQMTSLKTNVSNTELKDIVSPHVINIMKTIKLIQKRMKDPDVRDLDYIRVYDKLGKEFQNFSDTQPRIFTMVIRGENMNLLASILYYKDKVDRGLLLESQLADMVAKAYMPANLKRESDQKIKEMKNENVKIEVDYTDQ